MFLGSQKVFNVVLEPKALAVFLSFMYYYGPVVFDPESDDSFFVVPLFFLSFR